MSEDYKIVIKETMKEKSTEERKRETERKEKEWERQSTPFT